MYCTWSGAPVQVWTSTTPFMHHEKAFSVVTNSQSLITPLVNFFDLTYKRLCKLRCVMQETVTSKAWAMFGSRAFTHQYTQHGYDSASFRVRHCVTLWYV